MRDHSRQLVLSLVLGIGSIATAIVAPTATLAASTGATTSVTTATTCDEGRWPASAQGQPLTFHAGARAGDYLWHNGTGSSVATRSPSASTS